MRNRHEASIASHCMTAVIAGTLIVSASSTRAAILSGGDASDLHAFDFEEFADLAGLSGTAFNVLASQEYGVTFGEKLLGQINAPAGGYDVISGSPALPLAVDGAMVPELGVNVMSIFGTTVLAGLGPSGFPNPDAIGDGSLTVLYEVDQHVIGFDLVGTNYGTLRLTFWDRQGNVLDHVELNAITDTTYVYSSEQADIAAVNFNNTDWGGLAFDNFHFQPVVHDEPPACAAGGPYEGNIDFGSASVPLEAGITDGNAEFRWVTDCPYASFDDDSIVNPILSFETDACSLSCTVSVLVYHDDLVDVCTANVNVSDPFAGPSVSCPPDVIVSCGETPAMSFEDWLNSATSTAGTPFNDFEDFDFQCGTSGSAVVTWWVDNEGGSTCDAQSFCTATYTIEDDEAPVIERVPAVTLVDADCSGFESWNAEDVEVYDNCNEDVSLEIDEAWDLPAGTTSTVSITATDACGNAGQHAVPVTVLHNSGITVRVSERGRRRRRAVTEESASVDVLVYDYARGSCARSFHQGTARRGFGEDASFVGKAEHLVNNCEALSIHKPDDNGVVEVGLLPGQYLVIVAVDVDFDNVADNYVVRPSGYVSCGRWKTMRISH